VAGRQRRHRWLCAMGFECAAPLVTQHVAIGMGTPGAVAIEGELPGKRRGPAVRSVDLCD